MMMQSERTPVISEATRKFNEQMEKIMKTSTTTAEDPTESASADPTTTSIKSMATLKFEEELKKIQNVQQGVQNLKTEATTAATIPVKDWLKQGMKKGPSKSVKVHESERAVNVEEKIVFYENQEWNQTAAAKEERSQLVLPDDVSADGLKFPDKQHPPWTDGIQSQFEKPKSFHRFTAKKSKIGRFGRWKRSPEGKCESPQYFDFDSLEEKSPSYDSSEGDSPSSIGQGKGRHMSIDISTPPASRRTKEVGVQAVPEVRDGEVQADHGQGEDYWDEDIQELEGAEMIDGVLCKSLFMAIPQGSNKKANIGIGSIEHDKDENGFYKLKHGMTSDSGAADTVGPEEEFPDYPLMPSPGSKKGLHYVAAGGTKIRNAGQKRVLLFTKEKQLRWCTVQIAKVKKTLGSVSKNNDKGFDVVYSKTKGSFMRSEDTGEKTMLRRDRGVFVLDAWVVPYHMAKAGIVKYTDEAGRTKVARVSKNNETDFVRPAP